MALFFPIPRGAPLLPASVVCRLVSVVPRLRCLPIRRIRVGQRERCAGSLARAGLNRRLRLDHRADLCVHFLLQRLFCNYISRRSNIPLTVRRVVVILDEIRFRKEINNLRTPGREVVRASVTCSPSLFLASLRSR